MSNAQTSMFEPLPEPATEREAKRMALDALERSRRADIEHVAYIARGLCLVKEKAGQTPRTCMDEVRAAAGIITAKDSKRNNFLGCIFRARIIGERKFAPDFNNGLHESRTPGSHGNRILYWVLTHEIWN